MLARPDATRPQIRPGTFVPLCRCLRVKAKYSQAMCLETGSSSLQHQFQMHQGQLVVVWFPQEPSRDTKSNVDELNRYYETSHIHEHISVNMKPLRDVVHTFGWFCCFGRFCCGPRLDCGECERPQTWTASFPQRSVLHACCYCWFLTFLLALHWRESKNTAVPPSVPITPLWDRK